jgi:hypothetical protein
VSANNAMTLVWLRRVLLVAAPLALAVVLWWHPGGGDDVNEVYEGVRHDIGAWMFVHTLFLIFTPLIGLAAYVLVSGLQSSASPEPAGW